MRLQLDINRAPYEYGDDIPFGWRTFRASPTGAVGRVVAELQANPHSLEEGVHVLLRAYTGPERADVRMDLRGDIRLDDTTASLAGWHVSLLRDGPAGPSSQYALTHKGRTGTPEPAGTLKDLAAIIAREIPAHLSAPPPVQIDF